MPSPELGNVGIAAPACPVGAPTLRAMHPRFAAAVAILITALALLPQTSAAVDSPTGQLVSTVAASGTPRVLNGEVDAVSRAGFDAGTISGQVRDLALSDGRLWLAGAFTHVGGKAQPALATVDPATGGPDSYLGLRLAGNHNGGVTQVLKIGAYGGAATACDSQSRSESATETPAVSRAVLFSTVIELE